MTDTSKPVDVNADITPTTHTPINKVDAHDWNDLSISELHDEFSTLQNRYNILSDMGKYDACLQVKKGMDTIRNLINHRHANMERQL